jgi:predicted dehydrogenase
MRKPDAYFQGNWRTQDGSPVMINLVHDIDILRFAIGEIVQAKALRGRSQRGAVRIETGVIAFGFETWCSWNGCFFRRHTKPLGL